jgi:hypothetical protein
MTNYTFSFDYTVNDLKKYQNANITLQQDAFNHYIKFKCKIINSLNSLL